MLAGPPAPVEGRIGSHDPQLLRFEMEENPLLDPEDDEYYARTHTLDTRH